MALSGNVIVNVGCDYWYEKGTARLLKSLHENEYKGSVMANFGLPIGSEPHEENPYSFKVEAILRALHAGYKNIFWMDSSIYCNENPNHIFEILDEHGYFFVKTGYNCAQSVNDKCLKWFGVSRDEAEKIPEIASGFWGLNFEKEQSLQILNKWINSCREGCFKGSRTHDSNESEDKRFLFHRQDQSALSLSISTFGLKLKEFGDVVSYDHKVRKSHYICHGM